MSQITAVKTPDPFSRVSKKILDDPRLSWRAKGIVAYLIGKPDGWKLRVTDLVRHGSDGKHAIRAALNELREFGYARFTRIREGGVISEGEWQISDQPAFTPRSENQVVDSPRSDFQKEENQKEENQDISKNDSNKNDSTKIDVSKERFPRKSKESIPSPQEVKDYADLLTVPHELAIRFYDHYTAQGWKIGSSQIYDWSAKFRNWVRQERQKKTEAEKPVRLSL